MGGVPRARLGHRRVGRRRAPRRDELGWRARTPLEAGLAAFARWMDEQEPAVAERYRTAVGAA